MKILELIFLGYIILTTQARAAEESKGQSCINFRLRVTKYLIMNEIEEVKYCQLKLEAFEVLPKKYRLEIRFTDKNATPFMRQFPNLTKFKVVSDTFDKTMLTKLLNGDIDTINLEIFHNKRRTKIQSSIKVEDDIKLESETSFSELEVKPPKKYYGAYFYYSDTIDLSAQLKINEIENLDNIKATKD